MKVREAIASSVNNPMDGDVHVDEFVIGGTDPEKTGRSYSGKKKKTITAVQLTEDGKVKRMYATKTENFSTIHFCKPYQSKCKSSYRPVARVSTYFKGL